MRGVVLLSLAVALLASGPVSQAVGQPVLESDLKDNVKAKLVAVRRSQDRTFHLVAKFETLGKEKRELLVEFHSNSATPHERTLMTLVEAATGERVNDVEWTPSRVDAVFSLPQGGMVRNDRKFYEKCYLVHLKIKKGE